jgi:GR25 family glycosyltransferase involved in LPS biosynthesis
MKQLVDLDQYFDQIYCINLKSRPDRLLAFKKNFGALGTSKINFIEAIDGKTIDIGNWKHSRGALGCRLSHIAIYSDAIKNKYSKILILEDDVVIDKGIRKALFKLQQNLQNNWDLIYFGGTHFIKPEKINRDMVKIKCTLATHAIAINCSCLSQIITELEHNDHCIDVVLADLHPKLKVYGPAKPMAHQKDGYSNVEETDVNYNVSFSKKIIFKIKLLVKSIFRRDE